MIETMSEWPIVTADDDGIRPAGKPDQCLYCKQKVGDPHGNECVTVTKRVKLAYTFYVEENIPHAWGKEEIEAARNEGTWCADNAASQLRSISENMTEDECWCDRFKCEFVEVVDDTPSRGK